MAVAGDIVARLTADTKPFKRELDSATSTLGKFESSMMKVAGGLAAGFAAGAVASVVSKATSAILDQVDAVDELSNVAGRLDIPIEQLSALSHAANMADVDFDILTGGIEKMLNSLADAADGAKGPTEALARIGLSIEDLAGLNPSQQLGKIADGIAGLEAPARRVQTAMDLFGKSGAGLLNLLSGGSAGIQAATADAERFGLVIDELDAARVGEFDDAMKRLQASVDGLARTCVVELGPSLAGVTEGLAEGVTSIRSFFAGIDAVLKSYMLRFEALKAAMDFDFGWSKDLWQQAGGMEVLANDIFANGAFASPKTRKAIADFSSPGGGGDFGPQEGDFLSGIAEGAGDFFDPDAMEEWKQALEDAAKIIDGLRSPMDKLNEEWDRAQQLFEDGLLSDDQFVGRIAQIQEEMAKLQDVAAAPDANRLATTALAGSSQAASILNAAQNGNGVGNKQLQAQQTTNQHLQKAVTHLGTIAQNSAPPELFP